MKQFGLIALAIFLLGGAGMVSAGDEAVTSEKAPVVISPEDPAVFAPGFEISTYGAGMFEDGGDDALGGGLSLGYYFSPNVGVDIGYSAFGFNSEIHTVTADLILRQPLGQSGIAPYLILGGGLMTNGSTDGLYRLGGGLDVRFQQFGGIGLFADGIYNWTEDAEDSAIARLGVRIPF